MSKPAQIGVNFPQPSAEFVAQLLDVVADNNIGHALSDLEATIARLRAGADEAAAARDVVRRTPVNVLREALRLRASR